MKMWRLKIRKGLNFSLKAGAVENPCFITATLNLRTTIFAETRRTSRSNVTQSEIKPANRKITVKVFIFLINRSDGFVFGVCLDLDGDDSELSDNFFDLYPGREYKVNLGKNPETFFMLVRERYCKHSPLFYG